jgi:CHAT domain-containing protein
MLIVAEPRAQLRSLPTISNVENEAQCVQEAFATAGATVVNLIGSTTLLDVEANLDQSNFVHLACHGKQDNKDALQSCFCLGDGELTVNRLIDVKLEHPFFAFMSACETAKGDRDQPDQTVHLGAAMLFAGFKSVVATMW